MIGLKYSVGLRVVDFEGEHGFIESWESSPPIKPYFVRLDSGKAYRYYENEIRPETPQFAEKKRSYITGPFWIIESIDGEVYDIHAPTGINGFRSTYESALEDALKLANAEIERLQGLLANERR